MPLGKSFYVKIQDLTPFLIFLFFLKVLCSLGFAGGDYYLIIDKAQYRVFLKRGEEVLFTFQAGFGLKSSLYKRKRGDFLTPEGLYYITEIRPSSNYYYFIKLSYPNENDVALAYYSGILREGENSTYPLGDEIGIHGGGAFKLEKGERDYHWTQGCIALNNEDLKRLLNYIRPGQRVFILDTSKPLYEIVKKLAFPLKVRPLEFFEGELYLKLDEFTYWYFRVYEDKKGKRLLSFKEWFRGALKRELVSDLKGTIKEEEALKRIFLEKIHLILEPTFKKELKERAYLRW